MTSTDNVRRWRKRNPEKLRAIWKRYEAKPETKQRRAEYHERRKVLLSEQPILTERVRKLMLQFGTADTEEVK